MRDTIKNFRSILVANRGEIAARIIRTAKVCGLKTIAIYTRADETSPHVNLADLSVCIGDGPIMDSYLSIEKIIDVAVSTKAEAIHPGYGFLSENPELSRACQENSIFFVGPSPEVIEIMGNKAEAKKLAAAAGVPCLPGSSLANVGNKSVSKIAKSLGYPLMIKAAAGGGGKGMRLVNQPEDLENALNRAKTEAKNVFASEELILESALRSPRHIEIQILGDIYGCVLHLGERDCSIQRRHQKIIEEAPCPTLKQHLRSKMGEMAIRLAQKLNYFGAGTVEFLLDEKENFYFLEMNTRLQVEHPVTEQITGLDLVYLQLLVADKQRLPFKQEEVKFSGHAVEARLYAEDPTNKFLPSTGYLHVYDIPEFKGVRIDSGAIKGHHVTPFYDSMLAKVIGHGITRDIAINNLVSSLENSSISGVANNRDFLIDILNKKKFRDGLATTAFLEEIYSDGFIQRTTTIDDYAVAASLIYRKKMNYHKKMVPNVPSALLGWSSSGYLKTMIKIGSRDIFKDILIIQKNLTEYETHIDDVKIGVSFKENEIKLRDCTYQIVSFYSKDHTYQVVTPLKTIIFEEKLPSDTIMLKRNKGTIFAPMHGIVVDVCCKTGDYVKTGDRLLILEAMKMQHELVAPFNGTIHKNVIALGSQVNVDDLLIELKPDQSAK